MAKRLKNVGYGSKVNTYGVRFTKSEIQTFRNLVQKANRRQRSYVEQMQLIRSRSTGIDSRIPVEPLFDKKSGSLNRFKEKEIFNQYISKMRQQTSDRYLHHRYKVEVENFKTAISKVFDYNTARKITTMINKIPVEKLHSAFIAGELGHTGYVYYDPENQKANQLLHQLQSLL